MPTESEMAYLLEGRGTMKNMLVAGLWQMINDADASDEKRRWLTDLREKFMKASNKPEMCECGHVKTASCIAAIRENKPHLIQDYTRLGNSSNEIIDKMPFTYISG